MPRRINPESVKQRFIEAGYLPTEGFQYKNKKQKLDVYDIFKRKYIKLSLQTLDYNIKTGKRPLWTEPLLINDENTQNITPTVHQTQQSPLERFTNSHKGNFEQLPLPEQQLTYNIYKFLRGRIMRKTEFVHEFSPVQEHQPAYMRATVMALRDCMKSVLPHYSIKLHVQTQTGKKRYFHVNKTTLDDLWDIFKDVEPDFSVEDSAGNFALNTLNIASIRYIFKPHQKGKQVIGGFFPYINLNPSVDLSRYGIYSDVNDPRITEPCLLTAFRNANILNEEELNQLSEMINTREFPQIYLKNISEHFNINIYVKNYHEDNGKSRSSHVEYNNPSYTRGIRLMILLEHYALYEKVEGTNKFIYSYIKDAIKAEQMRKFTESELETVYGRMMDDPREVKPYNNSRKIVIRPPKPNPDKSYTSKLKHGEHFFGYKPDSDEIDMRLNELQEFVNSLKLRNPISVHQYFKFSRLMERIMYEYGCFDDVYELAGELRDSIRNSLVFPKRELTLKEINEKVYYLDFNGAFCSFMSNIPTGIPNPSNTGANTKIAELINEMYQKRVEAKEKGNIKLARTIKFIMCSCYGQSIAKPKRIKHKYSENIKGTLNNQGVFVSSYEDKPAGFVSIIQPYVEHYNYPQFAKVILDGFRNKVKELEGIVNILFRNIDAFVVNEADYNKLKQLGYVHPTELGKLKVEHVFSSMRFTNKMKWIGINEDGTEFRHCC